MKNKHDKHQAEPQADQAAQAKAATAEESAEAAQTEQDAQTAEPAEDTEALRRELEDYRDRYVRLMAEFDNYRRRTARERLDLIESAGEDILKGFLPVLDDCERALKVLSETCEDKAAIEGTELIYNKLLGYLKERGVTRIEAQGAAFDTDYHEAISQFPAPSPELKNTVIDVTRQGYMLHDKVVRFAQVVVGI